MRILISVVKLALFAALLLAKPKISECNKHKLNLWQRYATAKKSMTQQHPSWIGHVKRQFNFGFKNE